MVSTTGSSASDQRPPHPQGADQPAEAQPGGPAAQPKKNGKPGSRPKRIKSDKTKIPAQPDPDAVEDLGDLEEVPPASSAAADQKLILPSTNPADRGPKAAVTLADFLNEPPREGVKASEQAKLIQVRATVLKDLMASMRANIGYIFLFATASLLAIAIFGVIIHVAVPSLSLWELAKATVAMCVLGPLSFAGAIRLIRGSKGKGGA